MGGGTSTYSYWANYMNKGDAFDGKYDPYHDFYNTAMFQINYANGYYTDPLTLQKSKMEFDYASGKNYYLEMVGYVSWEDGEEAYVKPLFRKEYVNIPGIEIDNADEFDLVNDVEKTKDEGPLPNIITTVGGGSSVYASHIKFVAPTVHSHYKSPKYGTTFGIAGYIGDLYATGDAIFNLKNDPNNPESYTDMLTAILGWWPIVGDINAILYMGVNEEVHNIQENINNNVNPLQNTYVPATGDVLWW